MPNVRIKLIAVVSSTVQNLRKMKNSGRSIYIFLSLLTGLVIIGRI